MAAQAARQHGVIPDVLPESTNPTVELKISYNEHKVDHGNVLTPTIVGSEPHVTWDAEPGKLYTLVMTDPDAPSRANPIRGEWHHWLVLNIPGNKVSEGEVRKGYVGSGPPKDSGLHRYVFALYKHDQPIKAENEPHLSSVTAANRNNWKLTKFAHENNLGDAVGLNFYLAEWDDYVPKLYAGFKG